MYTQGEILHTEGYVILKMESYILLSVLYF